MKLTMSLLSTRGIWEIDISMVLEVKIGDNKKIIDSISRLLLPTLPLKKTAGMKIYLSIISFLRLVSQYGWH